MSFAVRSKAAASSIRRKQHPLWRFPLLSHLEGHVFVTLTLALLVLGNIAVVVGIFKPWFSKSLESRQCIDLRLFCWGGDLTFVGKLLLAFHEMLWILTIVAHQRTMTTDPGRLKTYGCPETAPKDSMLCVHRCGHCKRWKPPRAYHCRRCGTCIFRMDHHCPWVNNCIGLFNGKFFVLFLVYLILLCSLTLVLTSYSFFCMVQAHYNPPRYHRGTSPFLIIVNLLLAIECIAFIAFSRVFLMDMMEAFEENSTLVESIKDTHGLQRGFLATFMEVMGPWTSCWLPLLTAIEVDYSESCFPNDNLQPCHNPLCVGQSRNNSKSTAEEATFEDFEDDDYASSESDSENNKAGTNAASKKPWKEVDVSRAEQAADGFEQENMDDGDEFWKSAMAQIRQRKVRGLGSDDED